MRGGELFQAGVSSCGVAMAGSVDGFENQVRDAGHGGDHHDDSIAPGGVTYYLRALAYTSRVAHGRAAKFHHNGFLVAHSILPLLLLAASQRNRLPRYPSSVIVC